MKSGLLVCLIAITAGGALSASSDRTEPAGGGAPAKGHLREFSGSSILLFDPGAGQWHHNWIDTLGNVLEGRGSIAPYEESSLPAMITVASLGDHLFKHVWYDIAPDRFETDLYVSTDGGATYSLVRRMPFLRLERTSRE